MHFIKPFPLLLTSDSQGTLRIWVVRPPPPAKAHDCARQLVTKLGSEALNKAGTITAIDTHYDERTGQLLLLQGDETGEVCV